MITKTHSFFVLNPNPWALLNSISGFNLLMGLCLFLKYQSSFCLFLCITSCANCMMGWWLGYVEEFSLLGLSSFSLDKGLKTSMLLFISSEVFFFFSFFWSYFHFYLSPSLEGGYSWPPVGVLSFEALNVPFLNTLLLLSSGVLVTMSHMFLNQGKKFKCLFFLGCTVLLGGCFSFFQWEEYQSSFFTLGDGVYGTSFFMLTGFHGLHVLIGSLFLLVSFFLGLSLCSSSKLNFTSFEMACWYWHFVDVVWLFLFFFLYYLNE